MDSRELAYFIAVAEELNFSRAAERLGIAQPPLSRAVRQLERRLGVTLLTRTSRRVELTGPGEVLLREGRRALTALDAAAARTRRAADPTLVLTLKPGGDAGLLAKILARCAAEPGLGVDLRFCAVGEQRDLLLRGEADVALLHLPEDDPAGLATQTLFVDREVVLLPATHRLATRPALRRADLAGEEVFTWSEGCPSTGGEIRDTGQVGQLVALGRSLAILPGSFADHLPPELIAVPLADGATATVVMAWPEDSRSRALAVFLRLAEEITGPVHT
jgi:LysR family transcriptional regulator, benzoate and cis,cis-muconate-responsive activator of ben and cat genes